MVEITCTAQGDKGYYSKTVQLPANSWQINENGDLTVGDSLGNPDASYASGSWDLITKIQDEDDD